MNTHHRATSTPRRRSTLSLVALVALNVLLIGLGALLLFALFDPEPGASPVASRNSGAMLMGIGLLLLAVNYWLGWRKSCKCPPEN